MRQRLLLDAVDAALQELLVFDRPDVLLAHVFDGAGEEAAGAAGGVEDLLAQSGGDRIDHELGDRARRVILAGVAGILQVAQDLFVEVAEEVTVLRLVEVDAGDDPVDHLAHQVAGLHVVVGILEDTADDEAAPVGMCRLQVLEGGEEPDVDEVEQLVAGHALGVGRPVAPAQRLGDRRAVVAIVRFEQLVLGFLVVVDLEEEHPDELADALRVAIDADILAHDVLDGFDGGGEGHEPGLRTWRNAAVAPKSPLPSHAPCCRQAAGHRKQ